MFIRKATLNDVKAGNEIYVSARKYMKENGNPTQWSGDYPSGIDIKEDIEFGKSYVCEDGGEVVAVFAFAVGNEPCYNEIFDGEWLNSEEYAYIHRIAVKYHGRGIVGFCFDECFKIHPNLRIDTHKNNIPMQKALLRAGFKHCGTVYVNAPNATHEENARMAFQKIIG